MPKGEHFIKAVEKMSCEEAKGHLANFLLKADKINQGDYTKEKFIEDSRRMKNEISVTHNIFDKQ